MASVTGGNQLAARLRSMVNKLQNDPSVNVGFLGGATYPDGTSVGMVATINEFGAPSRGQPPRPFFRNMLAKESPGWPRQVTSLLKSTNYDGRQVMTQMGFMIQGQLVQSIMTLTDPPLAPSTVRGKGFAKPLIDTGVMWHSIDHEVIS